jgi:hypothetical protein
MSARGIPLRPDRDALAVDQRRSLNRASAALVLSRSSDPELYVRRAWPDDAHAARIVRAASAPASTANAGALQLSAAGVFRSLATTSAALRLFDRRLTVDLSGLSSVRVPSITTALPDTVLVGEGAPAPALNLNFDASVVGPVKK